MPLLDPALWEDKIFIGGWTTGSAGIESVLSPATGDELGSVGVADAADVGRAASLAAEAQVQWAARKPEERAAVMRRAGRLFEEHAQEITDWIIRESGSNRMKAASEIESSASECYETASLPSHPLGHVLPSNEDRWSFSRRRPAGVVSVISPFNVPLVLGMRSVAPALALGNAVLLKPDPRTSVCGGVVIMRIFEEAGLPAGVLSLLIGGADVGEAVVTAPEVRIVSFTGSTPAGRRVGALGAQHLKRTHLELGGKNALIVLPGADLTLAASAGAFGSFNHQGQICMATGRHLIHESLHDDYVEALRTTASGMVSGDPTHDGVTIGPLIDAAQVSRVDGIVQATVDAGATLAAGGTFEGNVYRPTVLSDMTREMPAWTEEIFGPVAPVVPFTDVEEAIRFASSTEYGLSLGILGDVGQAMQVADRIPSGIVHINEQTVSDEAQAPFGGIGHSGTGSRFGGAEANIEAFTETQWLTVRPGIATYPF